MCLTCISYSQNVPMAIQIQEDNASDEKKDKKDTEDEEDEENKDDYLALFSPPVSAFSPLFPLCLQSCEL